MSAHVDTQGVLPIAEHRDRTASQAHNAEQNGQVLPYDDCGSPAGNPPPLPAFKEPLMDLWGGEPELPNLVLPMSVRGAARQKQLYGTPLTARSDSCISVSTCVTVDSD